METQGTHVQMVPTRNLRVWSSNAGQAVDSVSGKSLKRFPDGGHGKSKQQAQNTLGCLRTGWYGKDRVEHTDVHFMQTPGHAPLKLGPQSRVVWALLTGWQTVHTKHRQKTWLLCRTLRRAPLNLGVTKLKQEMRRVLCRPEARTLEAGGDKAGFSAQYSQAG